MTKEDIKKALELCSKDEDCEKCPYCATTDTDNIYFRCMCVLQQDALTLITEQEKEIERLKAKKNDWKQRYESVDKQYMTFIASSTECIKKEVKQAKIDTLNELKVKYGFYSCYSWSGVVKSLPEIIDEFIKEVQNAEDKG